MELGFKFPRCATSMFSQDLASSSCAKWRKSGRTALSLNQLGCSVWPQCQRPQLGMTCGILSGVGCGHWGQLPLCPQACPSAACAGKLTGSWRGRRTARSSRCSSGRGTSPCWSCRATVRGSSGPWQCIPRSLWQSLAVMIAPCGKAASCLLILLFNLHVGL